MSSQAGQVVVLGAVRTFLSGAKCKLFQSSLIPTPTTLQAAFAAAIATFTGYADFVIVWSAVGIGADGNAYIVGSRAFFQATDGVTPNTLGGFWLEDAGGDLLCYGVFSSPIPIEAALDFIAITPTWGAFGPTTAEVQS